MFQTWWDLNKQNIRKFVDALAGAATGWIVAQGDTWALFAPAILFAVNYAWFWFDNKNKVTVKGLDAAGATNAAVSVEKALDTVKAFDKQDKQDKQAHKK